MFNLTFDKGHFRNFKIKAIEKSVVLDKLKGFDNSHSLLIYRKL